MLPPCGEHALNLMILALGHADIGRVAAVAPELRGARVELAVRIADVNSRLERGDIFIGQFAVKPGIIDLADLVPGRNNAVRELAVGGDDQQPLGVLIQPAGGHRAHGRVHRREQIHHGLLLFIPRGGQHAGRLVEHHMAHGLIAKPPAVQPNVALRSVHLHARVPRARAVHRHAPCAHHRLDFAPRALAEQRKQLVQPHLFAQNTVSHTRVVSSAFHYTARRAVLQSRGGFGDFLSASACGLFVPPSARAGQNSPGWTFCVQKLSRLRGLSWKHHMNLLSLLRRL